MNLLIACKAFLKALQEPKNAEAFVKGKPIDEPSKEDRSHIRLLALLQANSRLIDFLKEDIQEYTDQQIGQVVRKIHRESSATLEEHVTIRPVMEEKEGQKVVIAAGYDPSTINVVGNLQNDPPFHGTVRHRGWKAAKVSLPKKIGKESSSILQPAEIEVK
jgi:hypothetical protein